MPQLFEREGRWLTADQVREYNAKKAGKILEKASDKEGVEGKEKERLCVRDAKKGRMETKKEEEITDEDDIFIDEETTDPEPALEEIKSKPKKKK